MTRDIGVNAVIDKIRLKEQGSNPATPETGYGYFFIKSDGVYFKDDAGNVTGPFSPSDALTDSNISPTTTNISAAINTRYFADLSGLTANRNFVLPACSVGDEIELKIITGDDTYEFIIIGDTGVTIEGGSAATEWARTFLAKDSFRFVASGTNTWRVAYDGRRESYVMLQDQKTSGTNAGGFTSGSFVTRTLNTEVQDDDGICTLSSNQFTLRAGTYRIHAICPAVDVDSHRAKLYNTSDSADVLLSDSAYTGIEAGSSAIISGKFTITSTKTFEIRHQCQTTKLTYGLGAAFTAVGLTEYYTTVELWRVG